MSKRFKAIAVIYGSDSSEWEVSCRSGEFVASRLDGDAYDIYEILARFGKWSLVACKRCNSMRVTFPEGSRPEVDKTDFSVSVLGEKVKFDYAYIVQHGAPGETGQLQGYLEMIGVPFNTGSAFTCAVSFDKYSCKCYIREQNIVYCAPDALITRGDDVKGFVSKVKEKLHFPVFVKPTQGGSSFGVTKVENYNDLLKAIKFAFKESMSVIVEEGIVGRELTCAAYFDGQKVSALPPIEIITDNDYFDYDAKYNGHSMEVCPAEISESEKSLIQQTTCKIYSVFAYKGVVRMDYILSEKGLYFLEINNIPGMTSASLVPKMVRAAGMDMTAFLSTIIENS